MSVQRELEKSEEENSCSPHVWENAFLGTQMIRVLNYLSWPKDFCYTDIPRSKSCSKTEYCIGHGPSLHKIVLSWGKEGGRVNQKP